MICHFVVSTVEGVMIALCGAVVKPRDAAGAKVGVYGQKCKACDDKVKAAWVSFPR